MNILLIGLVSIFCDLLDKLCSLTMFPHNVDKKCNLSSITFPSKCIFCCKLVLYEHNLLVDRVGKVDCGFFFIHLYFENSKFAACGLLKVPFPSII